MEDADRRRLLAKVARLYYHSGLRQTEIAERLRISQTRVSRLLQQAETEGIVRTIVVPLVGLDGEIEERLEERYSVGEVHVVDTVSEEEADLVAELGAAAAGIFSALPVEVPVIGVTSESRTLRAMIDALGPLRTGTTTVVEMLGGIGPPQQQHQATRSTTRLATLVGAEPVYLRTPAIVPSAQVREALIAHDPYVREALGLLDALDLALIGVGSCETVAPLLEASGVSAADRWSERTAPGAVGQLCLRFLDERGEPVASLVDDLVTGVTPAQLRAAKRRWVVAGGAAKHAAVRAALLGGWVDTLVTDAGTARALLT